MFNETTSGHRDDAGTLGILARARPDRLKAMAESVLVEMDGLVVIANRTGLVMLPMRDSVQNVDFHLGEVLVSEAHIADAQGRIGYGMVKGRDLERAMAMAVIDLRLVLVPHDAAVTVFLAEEAVHLADMETLRMRQVEATRVQMETF